MPYASRVDALLEEAGRAARDDGAPRGTLVIGSLETTAALRLSPLRFASYAAAYPRMSTWSCVPAPRASWSERVLARELEGAAIVCGPIAHADLATTAIFEEGARSAECARAALRCTIAAAA